MEELIKIIKKTFFLPPLPTVLIAIPSFVLVFYVLGTGNSASVLSYAAYLLSAYAMIITVTGFTGIIRAFKNGIDNHPLVKKILSIPFGRRFLKDVLFRAEISLYQGFVLNLLYAVIKMVSGIYYHSVWLIALATYYILLGVMRFSLIHYVRRNQVGQNIQGEFRRYRLCGIILILMNIALVGIVEFIVYKNEGFSYPGLLIYAIALYAFYCIIIAMINVIKFRKHGSPVMSAAKVINLTAALVSMLTLTTAMLASFGGDDLAFRKMMTACVGSGVCLIVLGMGVFMLIHSTKNLKEMQYNNSETQRYHFRNNRGIM